MVNQFLHFERWGFMKRVLEFEQLESRLTPAAVLSGVITITPDIPNDSVFINLGIFSSQVKLQVDQSGYHAMYGTDGANVRAQFFDPSQVGVLVIAPGFANVELYSINASANPETVVDNTDPVAGSINWQYSLAKLTPDQPGQVPATPLEAALRAGLADALLHRNLS